MSAWITAWRPPECRRARRGAGHGRRARQAASSSLRLAYDAASHDQDVFALVVVGEVGVRFSKMRECNLHDVVLGDSRQRRSARAVQDVVEAVLARGAHQWNLEVLSGF